LIESAKLAGVEPKAYLRAATLAALAGTVPPLPHEFGVGTTKVGCDTLETPTRGRARAVLAAG